MPKQKKRSRTSLLPLLGLILLFLLIVGAIFYVIFTAVTHAPASLPASQYGPGKGTSPWGGYNPDWWLPKLHCYRPANALYCTDNASGN